MNSVGVCGNMADISPLTHVCVPSSFFIGSADGDGADGSVLLAFGLKHKIETILLQNSGKHLHFHVLKSLKYILKHCIGMRNTSVHDKNMEHTSGWWDYWAQKWAWLVH